MEEQIFIIQSERRNWGERIKWCINNNQPIPPITRRYLMMITNNKVREFVKSEFETHPYSENYEDIFYCIAGHSFRRSRDFIKTLMYKMDKHLDKSVVNKIEILEGVEATADLMKSYVVNSNGNASYF